MNSVPNTPNRGRVIASHGRHALVESREGSRILCQIPSRRLQVVCGDEVRWLPSATGGPPIVEERLPRRSALARTDTTGRAEIIVANLTQLIVVMAPRPQPDFFIMDRYLAAVELLELQAALVVNKADLPEARSGELQMELDVFERAGYKIFKCSANTGEGVAALSSRLQDTTSLLVGQSGVGKSSLANRLLPGLTAETAELSRATAEGKHTTSVSTLHHLPNGGDLIDSPGVRDFAPAIDLLADVSRGFREISAQRADCRFKDCRHLSEPGCAVRAALEAGEISPRRYESYRRLLRLSENLAPEPGRRR